VRIFLGSLFSGIGGIELGFEREGFETKWFIENNLYCQEVLKEHFPKANIYGDIKTVNFSRLEKVDILTGGFPCQDISIAGKKKGIKGERSSLWKYYSNAICLFRPRFAVIENVSNIINLGLNVVLADLAKNGYDAEWFTLSASDFGALHRRERIFIVAYPSSKRWNNGKYNWEREQVHKIKEWETEKDKQEGNKREFGINKNNDTVSSNTDKERCGGGDNEEDGKQENDAEIQRRDIPYFLTNDWGERIQRFRQESLQGEQGFSWCKDVRRIEDIYNRSDIPKPLIWGNRDGVSRKVDSYFRTERTKAVGNAVVPQVAQFIARRLKELI
jgi:DNA (cytosine-5)-methyltransferase 1